MRDRLDGFNSGLCSPLSPGFRHGGGGTRGKGNGRGSLAIYRLQIFRRIQSLYGRATHYGSVGFLIELWENS